MHEGLAVAIRQLPENELELTMQLIEMVDAVAAGRNREIPVDIEMHPFDTAAPTGVLDTRPMPANIVGVAASIDDEIDAVGVLPNGNVWCLDATAPKLGPVEKSRNLGL